MDFLLFILVTATLLTRPAEIVPALLGLPIYEVLIVACLAASYRRVAAQLRPDSLRAWPVTACVVGLLIAVVLSHLANLFLWGARTSGVEFAKLLAYYLLLVAVVNTPARLRAFLACLVGLVLVLCLVAMAQFHGLVEISSLTTLQQHEYNPATGEIVIIPRLRSVGIYNDPNDLSLILVVGILGGLYCVGDRHWGSGRFYWLAPVGVLGYGLLLTQSRGGFLSLLAGVTVLFQTSFGWRKTLALTCVTLPALFFLASARQTGLSTSEGTSQQRIQFWSMGLEMFRDQPVFGVGEGQFVEHARHVAHNSYVHCYAELGFLGGTLFLGVFGFALWTLHAYNRDRERIADPELRRLCPFLLAIVFAYAVGLMSLSRAYVTPTYAIVGLATVFARVTPCLGTVVRPRINLLGTGRLLVGSCIALVGFYVFVRVFARWDG